MPRHAGPGAARLHRIEGRLRAAEKAAVLGLPPGVDDDRLALADDVVVPPPDFGLDRLADRGHVLEVVVVLRRLVGPGLAQHADRRRRGVEDVDVELLGDSPGPPGVRIGRDALVDDAGRGQRQRAVHDVGVARDPADVRHAPVHVLRVDVLVVLRGPGDVGQIAAGAVLAALGLARRAARVHQEERRFRVHRHRIDLRAA